MFHFDDRFCNSVWLSLGGIDNHYRAILPIDAPDGMPAATCFALRFYVC